MTQQQLAVRFLGDGAYDLSTCPQPVAEPGDVVVRVRRAGICGTDLRILSRPTGHEAKRGVILGHEFAGEVQALGSHVGGIEVGDRIAVSPTIGCGSCRPCQQGFPSGCPRIEVLGITRDGGFASWASVPAQSVIPIGPTVPWRDAALLEPLATVLRGIVRIGPLMGQATAVFGGGPMGLLALTVLSAAGANPLVCIEPSPSRRQLALSCGAGQSWHPDEVHEHRWRDVGGLCDKAPSRVVDAAGNQLGPAIRLAAPQAQVLVIGYNSVDPCVISQQLLVEKDLRIIGTTGSDLFFADALSLISTGAIDLAPIVTDTVSLERFGDALDRMRAGVAGKVQVAFD